MFLEGMVVRSKLIEENDDAAYFEAMKDEDLFLVYIPGGESRAELTGLARALEIGEVVDLYAFARNWEYSDNGGEKKSGSRHYIRNLVHYDG